MAANDTLCFSDFDSVTGTPTLDGFVLPDPGVNTNEVEPGYAEGSRMTFGGSGFPPVIFQGIRNGNVLHLALFCRLDLSFDNEDVVVIALRPQHAMADQANARRIDIFPVYNAIGADETNPVTGEAAGNADDDDPANPANRRTEWGIPAGARYYIRHDHTPQQMRFWQGQAAGDPWLSYAPINAAAYGVRVRSWKPPVPTGTPEECCWSIELQLPVNQATGGADWINLSADGFGLYFNVIRLGKLAAAGVTPSQGWWSTQFRFPTANPANVLTGTLNETLAIDPSWYGTGLIPALQTPPGSNLGQGVHFHNDALGVGRRPAGSATTTLGHQISGTADNELVALVDNTSTTDAANDVTAEFRFANWGLGPAGFTSWALPSGLAPNPTGAIDLAPSASVQVLFAPWPAASVPAAYGPPHDHQCVWVQLNSTSTVNFVQSSIRRNMDFIDLSEVRRTAEISGVGYPPPASGSQHEFLLVTHARRILIPSRQQPVGITHDVPAPSAERQPSSQVRYIWVTEGFRRTGLTLTIGDKTTEVLDESPGAFGYIADHDGADDRLLWEITGPGLTDLGNGRYGLQVPDGGVVEIDTLVKTAPPRTRPRWPWWVWLLILLAMLLVLWLLFG